MKDLALIFDLDGTLWDSSVPVAEIWTEIGRKTLGPDFSLSGDDVRKLMGKTMTAILEEVAPRLGEAERSRLGEALFASENDYLATHPGALFPAEAETLARLKEAGFRLFIVSNCQLGYIENFLPLLEEGTFEDHMCWGDTHAEKAVTIRTLMEKHGIEKAIYVGDTAGDETASRRAGIPFFFASYGFGKAQSPDVSLEAFSLLPDALASYLGE